MNERLKELIVQNERIWNLYTIGPVQRAEVEDFAEAIIRECAQVASDYDGAHYIGTAIEEHFGVED